MTPTTAQLALGILRRLSSKFGTADDGTPSDWTEWVDCREAIAAIEAELAQPVEPMFWVRLRSDGFYEGPIHNAQIETVRKESGGWTPLYTSPPIKAGYQLVPMTKDQRRKLLDKAGAHCDGMDGESWDQIVIDAVEAHHAAIAAAPKEMS